MVDGQALDVGVTWRHNQLVRTRAKKACSDLFERLIGCNDLFPFFDSFLSAMPW
jgi:hypothetical protein